MMQLEAFANADDGPRLDSQCGKILALLERGPATNRQLAEISLKYTSRISELRKARYDIALVGREANGLTWYAYRGRL